MNDDPIVEEARKAGQAYIDSFNGDLKAVFADLQRRTEEAHRAGHQVASLPPRHVEPQPEPAKQTGQVAGTISAPSTNEPEAQCETPR
jgi:hypothetical protein